MQIMDADGLREIKIDGTNKKLPNSTFITGPRGLCIEVDRRAFVEALCREFNLATQPVRLAA
jgi:hypothetical protein